MNAVWEEVADYTYRLEVPGGWLYRYQVHHTHQQCVPAMVFVPAGPNLGEMQPRDVLPPHTAAVASRRRLKMGAKL